jgi:hypothetical protein
MMKKLSFLILPLLFACNASEPDVNNPYDNQAVGQEHEKVKGDDKDIDANSIQGLHKNIFKPTCANSGCHDGNFEPDFRTIESSYNTLVNQAIIKNDENAPLTSRVVPGNSSGSMLVKRLEVDLNNNSGIMPLVTEPGSDWPSKKNEYIQNVKNWIDAGALDQFGNPPTTNDYPVELRGIVARVNGNLAPRAGTYKSMRVSGSASQVEIWIAYEDDNKTADQLTDVSIDLSIMANDFDSSHVVQATYESNPLVTKGYFGEEENFHHKVVVPLTDWNSGDVVWIRTRVSDGVNNSELPNDNSLFRAKEYATLMLL